MVHYAGSSLALPRRRRSLGLPAGEIGVLIGPSGCGKTTLLRAVAGLERAQAGTISLAQGVVSSGKLHVPAGDPAIGMVFQDYALFPHLDVGRNVAFGLHTSQPLPSASARQRSAGTGRAGRVARRFPMSCRAASSSAWPWRAPWRPSPACCCWMNPSPIWMWTCASAWRTRCAASSRQAGATALFVTHDQLEAFAIGDRIGVMHEGQRLHQWDDAYTLYHRPATRFVADFIGHGVFTQARIEHLGTHVVVHTVLGDLMDLQECPLPSAYPGGLCDVLLRADDIVHDDHAPVKAEIIRKAFRGSEFLYTLRLLTGETVVANVPSHHDHALGEWIGIRAEVDHVVTFPREA